MKSYDFEGPCSDELGKDFDKNAHIGLSRDLLNGANYWNGDMRSGDQGFRYEIFHEDGKLYEGGIERTGHVLIRDGKVIGFMSYNFSPGPIEDIINSAARSRTEHIAKNIEDLLKIKSDKRR